MAALAELDVPVDADDPVALTIFPEMDAGADVPEITEACWGILGKSPAPSCTWEKKLSHCADLLRQTIGCFFRYELIVIVERGCQDLKDLPVAIFIVQNAAKIVYQRRQHERLSARQFDQALPAQPCCLFRIDIEKTEVSKGPIAQMLPDIGRNLSCKRPCPGEERGNRARKWSV